MFERLLRIAALLAFCAVSACSTLRVNAVKPASQAIAPVADTASTRYVAATTAAHPRQSGFPPLLTNTNALMSRIVLADAARHSIDLQYSIEPSKLHKKEATLRGLLVGGKVLECGPGGCIMWPYRGPI